MGLLAMIAGVPLQNPKKKGKGPGPALEGSKVKELALGSDR